MSLPVTSLRLIFQGRLLKDNETLEHYKVVPIHTRQIEDGYVVHLLTNASTAGAPPTPTPTSTLGLGHNLSNGVHPSSGSGSGSGSGSTCGHDAVGQSEVQAEADLEWEDEGGDENVERQLGGLENLITAFGGSVQD